VTAIFVSAWRQQVRGYAATSILLLAGAGSLIAAPLREARVTEVIRDVKLLSKQEAARPAAINDSINENTAVHTGAKSRAELTFTDQTLARVGANTVFSFSEGSRNLNLGSGAMLLEVPKGAGGGKISTPAVTAAVTGTTLMFEYNPGAAAKLMVLDGHARFCSVKDPAECVVVNEGEIAIFADGHFSTPTKFNERKVVKSARLIHGFKRKLPSLPLIYEVIRAQGDTGKSDATIPPPGGSLDTIDQKTNIQPPPPTVRLPNGG